MALITWDDKYLLGISEFDKHHRVLIEHINHVNSCFEAPSYVHTKEILGELITYAKYHFEAEESWMKELAYPNLANHALEHEKFFAKIESLIIEHDSGNKGVLSELSRFLKYWLFDHIINTDTQYKHYYSSLKTD